MKIEERKYNVYISEDGREFESENGCKDWEEEVRLRKKFSEFQVDREKLNDYKPENWEHIKWWFLRMCQPGGEQHPQSRREILGMFRMEKFYDDIKSEDDIKQVIIETIDSDRKDKKISLTVKFDNWLSTNVPEGNILDIYLTLFYKEGSLLHDMKKKGQEYIDWYIRLASNRTFKSDNTDLLKSLKDLDLERSSLLNAISDSFLYDAKVKDKYGKDKNEKVAKKIGDVVIYKPNDYKEISNEGRILYYMWDDEKEMVDSMIQRYIDRGEDVDKLLEKAFFASFHYGSFELKHHKQNISRFHYLLEFTKGKVKSFWHNSSIKEIHDFNKELRSYYKASDEIKNVIDKNILKIFIDNFNTDRMRLGEDHYVKRLTILMNEEEIVNLIINSNGRFLKDTRYYEIAKGLFNELLEEYKAKGLVIENRENCTYSGDGSSYFVIKLPAGVDREEYRKNIIENGAYEKETMRLQKYNEVINIVYKKSPSALSKKIQKDEKAKFYFARRYGDKETYIKPVYKKDFKVENKGSNFLIA